MSKLWQINSSDNKLVEAYTVGDDYIYDTMLVPYDLAGTHAHVNMLAKVGILTSKEAKAVNTVLDEIKKLYAAGKFMVLPEQEDCHTAIEQYVTEKLGDIGKKIHTGRSRNDQILVTLRLFMKQNLSDCDAKLENLAGKFELASKKYSVVPMPGYTHMQKAMPTTVGTWLGAYADAFKDLQIGIQSLAKLVDQNPLGSAAGVGVAGLEIDREFTTKELGLAKVQINPIYCGLSRGYFELAIVQQLQLIMTISARFACDMLLFTTQEFGYFSLPDEFVTGSSIMPNKKNYDIFEIMRGNAKVLAAYQNQIQGIVASIGSGFQRDLQLTKEPYMKSVKLVSSTMDILSEAVPKLEVHEQNLKAAMTDDLYATEKVYDLVKTGIPFREAYKIVKNNLMKSR